MYFKHNLYLLCLCVYLAMAKIMLTVKVEENLKPVLEQIADTESRSQGGQIEHWIKKDAKRLKIDVPKSSKAKP